MTLAGTWYFAPVSTDNVPLAEAAFLGRASSLSAIAAQVDLLGIRLNAGNASVGYYIPGTMFYAGVGVSRDEDLIFLSSTTALTEYRTTWSGTLGIAPLDGLLLTTDFQEHGYDPNITARYVGKLPNNHFYAGSVYVADHGGYDGTSYGLDFEYYLDDSTSLGLGFDDVGNRWELRGEKFFSKSWAAGVSAHTADFDDGFGVHVTWRH
jgi:hypothetical protein